MLPHLWHSPLDKLVHVVASDGIKFCGPFSFNSRIFTETALPGDHVTCLRCMNGWAGPLRED